VIGIIALLISILLPALSKARESATSIKCLSNLKQLGNATAMYAGEHKNFLPYPTTTKGEGSLWFNVLDPYLRAAGGANGRTGVAGDREYTPFKQCPVWDTFEGGVDVAGGQNALKEYARTYKMNSMLRHNNPYSLAKITEIRESTEWVYIGDGLSLDQSGPVDSQFESGQFSMEVDDKTQATPALRHMRGANMLFVDGHAEHLVLATIDKTLRSPQNTVTLKTWESEFVDGSGNPVDVPDGKQSYASQGLKRNPRMPLIWSDPGRIYR
jgi:prepilin-type processing-associated H-X9-DG protein